MFERFDGCRMSHLVVPHNSVVQIDVQSVGRSVGLLTYLTNRAQIYLEIKFVEILPFHKRSVAKGRSHPSLIVTPTVNKVST